MRRSGTSRASAPGCRSTNCSAASARRAADVYVHASGGNVEEVEENVREYMEQGYRHIRAQIAVPGYSTYGSQIKPCRRGAERARPRSTRTTCGRRRSRGSRGRMPASSPSSSSTCARRSAGRSNCCTTSTSASHRSRRSGWRRSWSSTTSSSWKTRSRPEDNGYFRLLRQQTAIPIAMGELFVNVHEYVPLISDRLIDFIRVHISDIGGLTPARKLATLCEFFGVRTAWHGPGDVSPVGHAINLHLDLAAYNFGIQEATLFAERLREVFPGTPEYPRRRDVGERQARPRRRHRRSPRREVPLPRAPAERRLAGSAPQRRHGGQAVRHMRDLCTPPGSGVGGRIASKPSTVSRGVRATRPGERPRSKSIRRRKQWRRP